MENSDKGKYLVVVAIIGALATVSVPIINHYFPSQKEKADESARTSPAQVPSATQQNAVEPDHKNAQTEKKRIMPPPEEDGSLDFITVQRPPC